MLLFEFGPVLAALFFFAFLWLFGLEERIDHYLSGYDDGVVVERPRPGWAPRTLISGAGGVALVVLLFWIEWFPPMWVCVVVLLLSFVWWVMRMIEHRRRLIELRRYKDAVERWRNRQTAERPRPVPVVDQPGAPRPPSKGN